MLQALRPSAASTAGHGGRPGVDIGDFTSRPKINLGFEPTALQKELMAAGAVDDGGGQFPASLYNDWFPNYYTRGVRAQEARRRAAGRPVLRLPRHLLRAVPQAVQ